MKIPHGIYIPPKPDLLDTIEAELNRVDINLESISKNICHDVALSASVLKTVNSAYFGLRNKIDSIPHSISLLGLDRVHNLVAGFLIKKSLDNKGMVFPRFWDEACNIAEYSASISRMFNFSTPDIPYALGLFHNVGIPIMANSYSDYKDTLNQANKFTNGFFTDSEDKKYEINHAVVGSVVSAEWGLSNSIRDVILSHHDVEGFYGLDKSEGRYDSKLLAILKLAEYCSYIVRTGKESNEWNLYGNLTLDVLGITADDAEQIAHSV